jgi:hypothetical protein
MTKIHVTLIPLLPTCFDLTSTVPFIDPDSVQFPPESAIKPLNCCHYLRKSRMFALQYRSWLKDLDWHQALPLRSVEFHG